MIFLKKRVIIYFVLFLPIVLLAQDIHFSQAISSPLSLNPSTAGNFDGNYRFNCNYKDQWRSVSKPYKTIFASADIVAFKKKKAGSYLGLGLSFYNDKAGTSNFATNQTSAMLAYNVKLNKYNFLAAGLGFGFSQKNINTNGLKWDNQFNGISYDANLNTGETGFNQKVNYMDFSAGLLWNLMSDSKDKLTIGASASHLNKPNQSFSISYRDPLDIKYVFHADAQLKIGQRNSSIAPMLIYTNQGKLNEILFGSMLKYDLGLESRYTGANKTSYVSFGAMYRLKDAAILLFNVDYKQVFNFGFSYDFNISGLSAVSKTRGGMELYIGYKGFFSKNGK
jgi:type IX secretion system PorP/SprF family membrane protein